MSIAVHFNTVPTAVCELKCLCAEHRQLVRDKALSYIEAGYDPESYVFILWRNHLHPDFARCPIEGLSVPIPPITDMSGCEDFYTLGRLAS